jgi:hypothetical protein
MLAQIVGLCCVAFIKPIGVVDGVRRKIEGDTSCSYRAQQSRFHLKAETESSLRNVVLNKRQDDG